MEPAHTAVHARLPPVIRRALKSNRVAMRLDGRRRTFIKGAGVPIAERIDA